MPAPEGKAIRWNTRMLFRVPSGAREMFVGTATGMNIVPVLIDIAVLVCGVAVAHL
jgi:hypothetical protein